MALLHVDFFSDVLGMCTSADVILPQQTSGQIGMEGKGAEGKLKTMYLLHGMSDDQTIWQRRTSIERYVSQLGIAVVMPTTHLAFYTDTTYGMRYWTYISEELPKICREFFPQMSDKKEDNLAAGLSMGGYGAWKLGLGASETFGAAASLSGCLDIIEDVGRHLEGDSRDAALFRGIYGSLEQLEGSDNDLMALAKKLKTSGKPIPRLYSWCGTECRKGSADRQLDSMEQILRIIRLEMEVIILCTGAGTIRILQQIFTLNIPLAFLDTD